MRAAQGDPRNSPLCKYREDLRDATTAIHPPVRLLALNWSLDRPSAEIHRTCAVRILVRGANPMTLHGDADAKSHEDVLWQFLRNTEPLNDGEADKTIEMDISEDLEQKLARARPAPARPGTRRRRPHQGVRVQAHTHRHESGQAGGGQGAS